MKSFQNTFSGNTFRIPLNSFTNEALGAKNEAALQFDHASVCCPADEVRGTVLEKHCLSGKVVFAIGDTVFLPDPLPALCIRHSLRRSLLQEVTEPILIADQMNRLIYDCCTSICPLSCFYAEYARNTKTLRYVNAGHDAPVLVRRNPEQVLRLDKGGPVFGLKESSQYSEGIVTLRSGDRLIAFTQGVIESLAVLNGRNAESALISLTRSRRTWSAFDLANRIVAECEHAHSACTLERSVFVASVEEAPSSVIASLWAVAAPAGV
jgi:sigma-B regulation protein RsbU (phosphoserine phosphatase)